ncbi:MAG: hypothetical protein ABR577_04050 [Pyrinomonadaceae bacterium]
MGYWDVVTGYQTWSDYISSQEQVKGFDNAIQKQSKGLEKVVKVGIANQRDYQTALESGLGALSGEVVSGLNVLSSDISRGFGALSNSIDFGFDRLANGIDQLNADFNLMMGDVIWKLEVQSDTLASILRTLQAPLDTQAKELRFRAEDAYQNGWYEEALNDFLESERKNYQDFAVHRSIGNIYLYHQIDLPKALEYFQKAAKYARPRDARQAAEAEYFAGVVCSIQHNFKDALAHMSQATALNPNFYDAFYMHAGFAAMLGDGTTATRSLETAIRGDARYHERAKTAQIFDKVRPQIQSLLDRLMQEIRGKAMEAKRSIENLSARCANLLPDGQSKMSRLFSEAELQLSNAKTYNDYFQFTKVPQHIESELRAAEQQRIAKERADQERAARERAEQERKARNLAEQERLRRERNAQAKERATREGTSTIKSAIGLAIVAYPIVGVGGCVVRIAAQGSPPDPMRATAAHDQWLSSPLRSYTTEAIYIPLLIIGIAILSAIVKISKAGNE